MVLSIGRTSAPRPPRVGPSGRRDPNAAYTKEDHEAVLVDVPALGAPPTERRRVLEPGALGLGLDDLDAIAFVAAAPIAAPRPTRNRNECMSGGVHGRCRRHASGFLVCMRLETHTVVRVTRTTMQ